MVIRGLGVFHSRTALTLASFYAEELSILVLRKPVYIYIHI